VVVGYQRVIHCPILEYTGFELLTGSFKVYYDLQPEDNLVSILYIHRSIARIIIIFPDIYQLSLFRILFLMLSIERDSLLWF